MKEDCARAILRLIAVVTILIGGSLATASEMSCLGASMAMSDSPGVKVQVTGMVADMGVYAVLSWAVIAVWGVVLYLLSPLLARRVVA